MEKLISVAISVTGDTQQELIDSFKKLLLECLTDGTKLKYEIHDNEEETYNFNFMNSVRDGEEGKFQVGDTIRMPDPEFDDLWAHSFEGTLIEIKDEDIAVVEDMDGYCFDIETYRLMKY